MPRRYSLVCDDRVATEIDALAREYGLTTSEVLQQLVEIGLERRETQRESRIGART